MSFTEITKPKFECKYTENPSVGVCLFQCNVAFNNFSVISQQCLVVTGSSMLTFIALPHWCIMPQTLDKYTWYHIQSHYPDTGSTSPSSTTYFWESSKEQLVPFLTTLYVTAWDRTCELPFPMVDTLLTKLPGLDICRLDSFCPFVCIWATSHENMSSGFCDQVRLKPACLATGLARELKCVSKYRYYYVLSRQQTTKASIGRTPLFLHKA